MGKHRGDCACCGRENVFVDDLYDRCRICRRMDKIEELIEGLRWKINEGADNDRRLDDISQSREGC